MTNLPTISQDRANLPAPAKMRQRIAAGQGLGENFSAGTPGGFPVLSIRAGKFHLRLGRDQEVTIPDPTTGYPANFLDVVLVNASKQLSKAYYAHSFVQGNQDQPDCWSLDSVRPDPSVVNKVNPTCQDCSMNIFGSRMTPDGKAAKACSDHRRVALVFPGELGKPDPQGILLRVPQSSLRGMRNYVDQLTRNGFEPGGCVTRLSFETEPSFPKLEYTFVGPLTEQEYDTVLSMVNSPNTAAMLQGADFKNVAAAANQPSTIAQPVQPQQRQAPLTIDAIQQTGFGPGDLEEQASLSQPVQPSPMPPQQQAPGTVELIDVGNGELLNPATGEITKAAPAKAEPELDPDVIKVNDGRFYHRSKGKFVDSPYKDAKPAVAKPAEPAKRKPRAKAADQPAKQEAAPAAAPEPQQAAVEEEEKPKPMVVAASPKLEALISGLSAKKNGS